MSFSEMSDAYKQKITFNFYASNIYGQQTLDGQVYVEAAAVKNAYDLIFEKVIIKKIRQLNFNVLI